MRDSGAGGVFGRGHHRGGGGFWGLVADGDRQCSGRRDLRLLVEGRGVPVFQDFFDRHLGECRRVVADEDTEDLHRGGAALRLFGEAGLQERPEPLVHSVEAGRLVEDPVDDRGKGFVVEGRLSGGGEHHDPGPGEDVHGRGEFASFHLFRGHVGGGADDGVGRGHRGLGVPGDPEVDHPGAVRSQQDVGRFEVAVDHACLVDRHEGGGGGDSEPVERGPGPRPVTEHGVAERRAFDVLADDVGRVRVDVGVQKRRGAEGGDFGGRFDLFGEPAARSAVGGPGGLHDFDGDAGAVGSFAEVHHALAALADTGNKVVIPDPSGVLRP